MSYDELAALWSHVARLREKNGDKLGAKQARQNAKIMRHGIRYQTGQRHAIKRPSL